MLLDKIKYLKDFLKVKKKIKKSIYFMVQRSFFRSHQILYLNKKHALWNELYNSMIKQSTYTSQLDWNPCLFDYVRGNCFLKFRKAIEL